MEAALMEPAELLPEMCEELAEAFLAVVAPEHLEAPGALDLVTLVLERLPQLGVVVEVVDHPDETRPPMARNAAADMRRVGDEIRLRMLRPLHHALTRWRNRAERQGVRQVTTHELGHLWHCGFGGGLAADDRIGWRATPDRWSRETCDPERQADLIGASLLAPRRTLMMVDEGVPLDVVAQLYDVSEVWLQQHLHRLGLAHRHPPRDHSEPRYKWVDGRDLLDRIHARRRPSNN